eukprot:2706401-Pyramimonas_sp.AAC.1
MNRSLRGSRYWEYGSRRAGGCAEALSGLQERTVPGCKFMNVQPAKAARERAMHRNQYPKPALNA